MMFQAESWWRIPIAMLALTLGVTSAACSEQSSAASASDDVMVLEQHTLNDPGTNNMPSHTILAPAGWTVEGSAFWAGPNMFNILPSQDIKATSPAGVQVHIGPNLGAIDFQPSPQAAQLGSRRPAEGTAQEGYIVLYMPNNLNEWQSYLQNKMLPQGLPDATDIRVEQVVVVPELTELIKRQYAQAHQQVQQQNQQWQAMGVNMRSAADAAVLAASCSYTLDGRRWEHLFVFGSSYMMTETEAGRQIWWTIEPNVGYRAPAGELESHMPLLMTISNSVQPTPQWQQMKLQHAAKLNQIAARGAAQRSNIIAESNREISRIISEGWENRQASMDRTHRKFINAIREVDDYAKPDGEGTVQLPQNYQHVYTNGSQYILTNDVDYDPNRDQTINNHNWERMQRADP